MKLRYARPDDAGLISTIHAESWRSAYKGIVPQAYLDTLQDDFWVNGFVSWLEQGLVSAQLIFDGDKAVGCVAYGRSRDETLPGWGEIISLYLLPEYFARGYGKPLLDCALRDLRGAGFQDMYLWVLKANARARGFYEKYGLVASGDTCTVEILGEKLTEVRYVCALQLK